MKSNLLYLMMMAIVMLGLSSCGSSSNANNSDSSEDSVTVDFGASIDENGDIVVTDDGNGSNENVGVVEVTESNPIDESLERLANALAQYLVAEANKDEVMRKAYADDVITESKYLKEHLSEMTESQRKLFDKLNSL